MRTKHLLTAMVLPLAFAACSQEEIVSNENLSMTNRKTVENVVLNFEGEAASRMIYQYPNYVWEAGDQYGACLMDIIPNMDNYKNPNYNWYAKFDLVNYIHTNYPFTKQVSGYWTSEAVMSEGNYFFYFPYNTNMGGKRSPIVLDMPQVTLEQGDKAVSVFDNQLFVGYSKIVADPTKENDVVDVTMQPVLAAAGFKMTNVGTTPITVRKVAFVKKGGFPTTFEIKPEVDGVDFNTSWFYNADNTADGRRAQIMNIVANGSKSMDKVSVTYAGGRALGSQQALTTYILMPEDNAMQNTELHIYTNKGVGIIDLTKTTEGTTSNYENDITLTSVKYGDVKTVNINFDDATLTKLKTLKISTTDELEDLVAWNANITDNTALEAELLPNAKVELSKKVVDMLNANEKLTLYINSDVTNKVTVPANAPANAYDKIVWNSPIAIQNNGTVDNYPANNNITIVNKGTQVIKTKKLLANIENEGEITFQANGDVILNVNNKTIANKNVINWANSNLSKKTTLTNLNNEAIVNYGVMNFNAQVSATGIIKNANTGVLNVNKNLTAAIDNHAANVAGALAQGIINVNATWNALTGMYGNEGTINVAEEGKLSGRLFNTASKVKYGANNALTHYSTINNAGVVENITNDGYVIIMNTTATYSPEMESSDGYVNNNILNRYVVDSGRETIYITLEGDNTTSALKTAVETSNAEEIRIKGNLTINATSSDTYNSIKNYHFIKGNCKNLNVVTTGDLNILGTGSVGFAGNTVASKFTVSGNTTTDINSYTNLSVFNGTIQVDGTLKIQASASVKGHRAGSGTVVKAGTWK